jgi:hypothetical protein
MGGGGDSGGGGGSQTSTSYNTNIPEYARPYVETMLGSAQQELFEYGPSEAQYEDVPIYGPATGYRGSTPGVQIGTEKRLIPGTEGAMVPKGLKGYKPFSEDPSKYFAGFSPLQEQSFQGAANMQPSQQLGTATDLALAAGIGGLGTNYRPGEFSAAASYQPGRFSGGTFNQGAADFYMNPYQQSVTDIGKREAARQSAIQGTQQQAQATQAGAFGGGRDAIMRAERERNLGQQMGDIQAQGSNAAFQQAQQQFNADQARRMQAQQTGEQSRQYGAGLRMQGQQLGEQSRQYGAGLGMQGLQTALQGASQLGQLGGQEFQQGMDINKLQNQMGSQQQQQQQAILNQQIQNYATAQQYPMMQLSNMSNLLRGMPMQSTTVQGYQAQPNPLSQLGGLGLTAAGIAGIGKAKGGRIKEKKRPAGLAELALLKMQ